MTNLTAVPNDSLPFAVVVVDDDPRVRTRLAMQLGELAHAASYPSIAVMAQKIAPVPTVALFGPSFAESSGLSQISEFVREHLNVSSVLVVEELSTQLLQQAIRAGVADVITVPQDAAQLAEAVDRAAENLNLSAGYTPPVSTGAAPPPKGRILTVFSTKGGAGKSFVATNLAVLLARRSDKPVCLVDCDLQFGDAAVMLKLVPQHTIADAVGVIERLDVPLIRSLLVRHDQSGLLVLPAPTEPAFADQIKAEDVVRIIQIIRSFCSHVVVDTPTYFTEVVIRMLEEADDIVLVAGMDVPNIKNVKLGLNTLRLLNLPESKVKMVINRANSKVKIDVAEVERALGLKADSLMPSDIAVPQSINKGVPVVLDSPRSGVARSMEALTELFLNAPATAKGRR
ncbi:MAG: hypothetical protein NVS3B21_00870 [Acidimicrobiales bacterium]